MCSLFSMTTFIDLSETAPYYVFSELGLYRLPRSNWGSSSRH